MELKCFLEECLNFSEIAYKQELERQKEIGTKLDYLFKWLTIFVAVGNIGVPLIAKYAETIVITGVFWILYGVLSFCLVGALTFIIVVQLPRKQVYFPLGTDICEKAKKDSRLFDKEEDWYYQKILYWDNMTRSLEKRNNKAICVIRIIDGMFIMAIVLLSVLFVYILRGTV